MKRVSNIDGQTYKILEDFFKATFGQISVNQLCNKYKLTRKKLKQHAKRFVTDYNIDARFFFTSEEIEQDEELKASISDANINKPVNKILKEVKKIDKERQESLVVKGVSTLYDSDGNVKLTWVKESADEQAFNQALKAAIEKLCDGIPKRDYVPVTVETHHKTLTLFPLADLHFGLKIEKETNAKGYDWDLDKAIDKFYESTDYLLEMTPPSEECVIADLGDLTHHCDNSNQTPKSGHHLDVSASYEKTMLATITAMIEFVDKCLLKFERVYFYSVPGNHNDRISLPLKLILRHHFDNYVKEGRFFCNTELYSNIFYHKFGKCLLAFTHGDEIKGRRIQDAIYADNEGSIDPFKHIEAYVGHYHQNKMEQQGRVVVRTIKNTMPNDRWANSCGFRSNVAPGYMQAFVYHEKMGLYSTTIYNPVED